MEGISCTIFTSSYRVLVFSNIFPSLLQQCVFHYTEGEVIEIKINTNMRPMQININGVAYIYHKLQHHISLTYFKNCISIILSTQFIHSLCKQFTSLNVLKQIKELLRVQ